jgi:23S rRNA (cytosine1962-C5)-methyltransferase
MLLGMAHPAVTISTRGAERLRQGHPWIYRSDIRESAAEPGDLVRVVSERGRPLGVGFWSSESQISLRFLGPDDVNDERAMFASRIGAAVSFRKALDIDATAWRAVNAEGDRLPGLVIDVYGEGAGRVAVIQTLTQAMDRRIALIAEVAADVLEASGVLARNDQKVRRLEGLAESVEVVRGTVPDIIDVLEGQTRYGVDVRHGQKTGLFLDQRENHEAAARYARGRALDGFTYNGGFALRLAGACDSVLALDSSAPAVAATRANAERNGVSNLEVQEANVFDALRELEIARERFDTVVLDPPAFAKNKAALERAAAGYKEINLRALRILKPGGVLVTCTCSYHMQEDMFEAVLEQAASDAHATVTVVEKRAQARDHPILLGVPETHYLKCFVLRKLA